jgi:hypothetical protein
VRISNEIAKNWLTYEILTFFQPHPGDLHITSVAVLLKNSQQLDISNMVFVAFLPNQGNGMFRSWACGERMHFVGALFHFSLLLEY